MARRRRRPTTTPLWLTFRKPKPLLASEQWMELTPSRVRLMKYSPIYGWAVKRQPQTQMPWRHTESHTFLSQLMERALGRHPNTWVASTIRFGT